MGNPNAGGNPFLGNPYVGDQYVGTPTLGTAGVGYSSAGGLCMSYPNIGNYSWADYAVSYGIGNTNTGNATMGNTHGMRILGDGHPDVGNTYMCVQNLDQFGIPHHYGDNPGAGNPHMGIANAANSNATLPNMGYANPGISHIGNANMGNANTGNANISSATMGYTTNAGNTNTSIANMANAYVGNSYMCIDPYGSHPRKEVTPNMLYAYAHMRGPHDNQCHDPLLNALYTTPLRSFDQQGELEAPKQFSYAAETDLEELPKGAKYYWDPVIPTPNPAQSQPAVIANGPKSSVRNLTYDEFIKANPPTVGNNHYKGNDAYANFGYVQIDGKWVDPESEGELYSAYKGSSGGPYAAAGLREIHRSQALGPRIMLPEEQNKFYAEMADSDDGEGDPRQLHIDPATFARLAAGATKGEKYEETDISGQTKIPNHLYYDGTEKAMPPDFKVRLQVDQDMGDMLSGVYELEKSPKLVKNPPGNLNMFQQPITFPYMDPRAALRLEKEAFGTSGEKHENMSLPVSAAYRPERFTSEAAARYQSKSTDRLAAFDEYQKTKENVSGIRGKIEDKLTKNKEVIAAANKLVNERMQLTVSATMMRGRLDAKMQNKKAAQQLLNPALQSMTEPSADKLQRWDYRRHISDAIQREEVTLSKVTKTNEHISAGIATITEEVEALKIVNSDLADALQKVELEERDGFVYLSDNTPGKPL